MYRLVNLFITGILLVITLAAFSLNEEPAEKERNTLLVKDGAGPGRDLIVPASPQRAVFLNSSSLDLFVGAGGRDRVAAYIRVDTAPAGLYDKLPPHAATLGFSINVSPEAVLAQNPDLVVAGSLSGARLQLGPILERAGVPLLNLLNDSVEDTFRELRLYGEMTGFRELAEWEAARLKRHIDEIALSHRGGEKPKVALIFGTPTGFSLLGANCRQGEFVTLAGGENILETASSYRSVPASLEYIAARDPDFLLFITMGNRAKVADALDELLAGASSWRMLRAVKQRKVYVLPPELFSSHYGLSIDKAVEYMHKLLYPPPS